MKLSTTWAVPRWTASEPVEGSHEPSILCGSSMGALGGDYLPPNYPPGGF